MEFFDWFKTNEQKRQDEVFANNRKAEIYQWVDWITAARKASLEDVKEIELRCHACKDTKIFNTQDLLGNNDKFMHIGCSLCDNSNIPIDSPFIQKVYKTMREDEWLK